MEIFQDDVYYGSGEIDAKTEDSGIVWVLHDDGQPRRLYFKEDGFSVIILDPDPSVVQNHVRAMARGWT
ncbi:hypothetical protein ACIQC5_11930 [Paenarthrobacter sp. NPDC092416]|uniref:hypothetical protein n=1 Tax=Paenarthrobacter sp. NPDC092416 TaxID=3364386 RepID=UPI003810C900